jgi:hypothetical protein
MEKADAARLRSAFAKRSCAAARDSIHRTWMSHAITAHNNRLATMMKMRVLRPLQRSGRLLVGGVGVSEGGSDMRQAKVLVVAIRVK